jgi:hypothetical protein
MTGELLPTVPIACELSATAGAAQLRAWREFNSDYQTSFKRRAGVIIVDYLKRDASMEKLAGLVRTEQACCAFADWRIDATQRALRLVVTGRDDALDALVMLDGAAP